MKQSIEQIPSTPTHPHKVRSTLDPETIEHLKDLALDNRVLDEREEDLYIEELEDLEQSLSAKDPNFKAELDYNGYRSIEGYDNDEMRANMDDEEDDLGELHISDRMQDESNTEENITDKQDNKSNENI